MATPLNLGNGSVIYPALYKRCNELIQRLFIQYPKVHPHLGQYNCPVNHRYEFRNLITEPQGFSLKLLSAPNFIRKYVTFLRKQN